MSEPETPQGQYEADMLPELSPGFEIVQSSIGFDDSPEGMFRWDRMTREAEAEREALSPAERAIADEIDRRMDDAILYGDRGSP